MRVDSDLLLDAGDISTTARSMEQRWRLEDLERLAPSTLERAAALLELGAHRSTNLAHRYRALATHRKAQP